MSVNRFYRVDRPFMHGQPAVFIYIPTGKGDKGA